MQKPLDPLSVDKAETPSVSYVLRRRYGSARHIIAVASWVTVISMLLQPVAVLAASTVTWDANAAGAGQTDGLGVWLNANQWWTGSVNQTWVSGDDAVFGNTGAGGAVTLANPTVVNSLAFNSFTGTYTLGTAAQTITLNSGLTMNNVAGAVTIISPITLGGSQSWTHNDDSTFTVSGAIAYNNLLTLAGSGVGAFVFNNPGTGTGGLTVDGAWLCVQNVALGATGNTLTLNAGRISSDGTGARIIANCPLAVMGNVTFGDTVKTGALTFSNASQQIASGVTITALSAVTFGTGLTVGGAVQFRGSGTVTLQSSADIGNIPLTIGDNATFSGNGVGGTVSAVTTAALGTGNVTVNYGGTLTLGNVNYANTMTVNAGGTLNLGGNTNTGLNVTVNSMGTIGGSTAFAGTLPSAGALFVNAATTATKAGGITPSGTLTFGGTGALTIDVAAGPSMTINANRTIAFNATSLVFNNASAAVTTFTDGLTLNANLTVAGTGFGGGGSPPATGLLGLVPWSAGGVLNTVTQDATARSLTIAMAPTGMVSINSVASTYTGDTVIRSGTLLAGAVAKNTGTAKAFPNSNLKLDGGVFRLGGTSWGNNDTGYMTDAITVLSPSTVESWAGDNGTFYVNGAFSGSSRVTLRALPGHGNDIIGANNSSFTGGFNLQRVSGTSSFAFNIANSLGGGGNGSIVVGKGVSFRLNFAPSAGDAAKFAMDPGGESLFEWQSTYGAINLNTLGWDVRIGGVWAALPADLTGVTPYGSTYKLASTGTISTANSFTGARNLDIRPGAVAYGATDLIGAAITISAAQNYSGTTVISGVVKNALMGGLVQGSSVAVSADISAAGAVTVDNAAALTLTGTGGKLSATSGLTVKGSISASTGLLGIGDPTATNNNGVSDRIVTTADLTLGGDTGGGILQMRSPAAGNTHAQTLDILTIASGASAINANAATGTLNLTFTGDASGYLRNAGGVVNYVPTGFATTKFNIAPTITSVIGGILVGATYNGVGVIAASDVNWAEPGYTTKNDPDTWATGENVNNSAAYSGTLTANRFVNSVKSVNAAAGTINLGTNILTIESGMLVHSPNVALAIRGSAGTPTDGELRTANGQDLALYVAANTLTVSSKIGQQGGTTTRALTKAGAGAVTLANANNQIGDIYALGGTITANLAGALGSTSSTDKIYMFGGTLSFAAGTTQNYTNRKLVVGPQGGTYTDGGGATTVSSLGGAVTLGGNLTVSGTGDKTLSGAIGTSSGGGEGMIVYYFTSAAGRLTLSGNNQYWTGGFIVGDGAQVRLASANASGTGPIVIKGSTDQALAFGTIEFTGNTDGARTVTNDIIGQYAAPSSQSRPPLMTIANAKTDAAVTLSGKVYADRGGGLNFQGYDNGLGGVSETVLSGSVSLAHVPDPYNYAGPASGNATSFQQFINGQGGINLGVTAYRGTTATRLAYGSGGFVVYGGGTTTPVENGAEGYVRCAPDTSGNVNSLIPGAVGPGYVAALRKGGAPALNFGYLLTGTSGGTTYTLPEGKSFVIGTLGSGSGQTGTFGTAHDNDVPANTYTTTFLGNPKAAAGQLLAGLPGGDINIHGNADGETASLNLSARLANDVLVLGAMSTVISAAWGSNVATIQTGAAHGLSVGHQVVVSGVDPVGYNGTYIVTSVTSSQFTYALASDPGSYVSSGNVKNNVVFTPTYGDSGATSAITLMRNRTGNTTLNKTGAGTLLWNGAVFTDVNGSSVDPSKVTLNVNTGTLGGTGTIAGNVVVASGGTLKPGTDGTGTLNVGTLTMSGGKVELSSTGGTVCGKIVSSGAVSLSGTLALNLTETPDQTEYILVHSDIGLTGQFSNNTPVSWNGRSYELMYTGKEVKLVRVDRGSVLLCK